MPSDSVVEYLGIPLKYKLLYMAKISLLKDTFTACYDF